MNLLNKYIQNLTSIIRDSKMENTYKMSWIRSIVEHSTMNPNTKIIPFENLSPLIFKYYWNQTIFFDLHQGPNFIKKPKIHQLVLKEIDNYKKEVNQQSVFFTKVENKINVDIKSISKTLKQDVSWRFIGISEEEKKKKSIHNHDIYNLDLNKQTIEVHHPELLKEYSDILFQLINYRWTQQLEKFNSSPRISKKVNGSDRENIKRPGSGLKRFDQYLDIENPNHICFISGDKIEDDLSRDHVIPWSYLYSDDIWNIVYVKK